MLENGMFLIDRYEILSKVGVGGMADVYKAKDHMLGRIVAVKIMKPEFSEDLNFVTKFRTEAQSAAGLEHPNIVNIYDVGSENGLHFIVMEYIEGITLKTYIEKKGQLSFKEATSIAIQVARGIEAAHGKEIIHRDIKPQNIIISTEGKVKVTDFGIARAISSNTISAEVMGSVHYASPEQARNGFVDGRSDIYSLGIVMYEMVTGRVPFDGDTTVSVALQHLQEEMVEPSAYAPELPISYEKIVLKATQKNPDRRYQTIEELLADLRKALSNPEEDFVVIAPAAIAKTRVIGTDELEEIQNSAAEADLESENTYASYSGEDEEEEYDEEEYYDDEDDEDEEEDNTGFLNPRLEKVVNIALVAVAILIVAAIIWLGTSVIGLLQGNGGSTQHTKPSTPSESVSTPNDNTEPDSGTEPNTDEYATMIDVTGLSVSKAKEYLEALGFKLNIIAYKESEEEDDTVLEQSEVEGTQVLKGTIVDVVLAGDNANVELFKVPDVSTLNYDLAQATSILEAAGFKIATEYEYDEVAAKDTVFKQDIASGSMKKKGTTVTVYISRGKAPVEIPNTLVGEDKSVAEYVLEGKGFVVEFVEEESTDITEGKVLRVEGAGSTAEYGSTVKVYISVKEIKVTVPSDLAGMSERDAKKALKDLGFTVAVKEESSEDITKGKVIRVTLDNKAVDGTSVKKGSELTLVISSGAAAEMVEIPAASELEGLTEDEIKALLSDKGITKVTVKSEESATVEAGKFIRIEVNGEDVSGKEIAKDSKVTVFISAAGGDSGDGGNTGDGGNGGNTGDGGNAGDGSNTGDGGNTGNGGVSGNADGGDGTGAN